MTSGSGLEPALDLLRRAASSSSTGGRVLGRPCGGILGRLAASQASASASSRLTLNSSCRTCLYSSIVMLAPAGPCSVLGLGLALSA